MAYGSGLVDNIIPTTDLTVTGNITNQGNITCGNIAISSQGKIYPLTSTSVVATSGNSTVVTTGIPTWATKINIIFGNISSNGTSTFSVQLGYGSTPTWQATGYLSTADGYSTANGAGPVSTSTTSMLIASVGNASANFSGIYSLINVPSTNTWIGAINGCSSTAQVLDGGTGVTLSGALTSVKIFTTNGTDVFDSGNVCVFYE